MIDAEVSALATSNLARDPLGSVTVMSVVFSEMSECAGEDVSRLAAVGMSARSLVASKAPGKQLSDDRERDLRNREECCSPGDAA